MKSREDGETQCCSGDHVHVKFDKFLQWKKENKHRLEKISNITGKGGKFEIFTNTNRRRWRPESEVSLRPRARKMKDFSLSDHQMSNRNIPGILRMVRRVFM